MQDLIPTNTCATCGQSAERGAAHTCRTLRQDVIASVNRMVKDDLGLLPDLIAN